MLGTLQLLTCARQPYAQTTAVIGPAGGQIVVGAHRLVIPAGALSAPVRITAEQVSGTVNSVRFSPEGLKFAKPATLTLSYGNCLLTPLSKQVVYTNEQLRILEVDEVPRPAADPHRHGPHQPLLPVRRCVLTGPDSP